jgi:hypothetical protein
MSQNNPDSSDGDGGGGDKPPSGYHEVARAIKSLNAYHEAAQNDRAEHDRKVLFWNRLAGIGVAVYTFLTVVIAGAGIWAAIYSGQQAAASREANLEGQRAIVTFSGLRVDQQTLGNPGLPYVWFTVLVQNSGNTPTKRMRYFVDSSGALASARISAMLVNRLIFLSLLELH